MSQEKERIDGPSTIAASKFDGGVAESNAPVAPGEVRESRPSVSVDSVVRDYILGLTEHRPSDVEEAIALTALEQLRRERDDFEQRLRAYKRGERG